MFNIGTRIVITSLAQGDDEGPTGTVVGYATYQSQHVGDMEPAYCIRLDQGVWAENRFAFIDTLIVHPHNVEEPGNE